MQHNKDVEYRPSIETLKYEIRKLDDRIMNINANKRKLKRLLRELE